MDFDKLTALRAESGAAFLDRHRPGWERELNEELSMGSMRKCALAKLFGHFREGASALDLDETDTVRLGFRACSSELGNDLRAFERYYARLTKAWKSQRARRLAEAPAEGAFA